MITAERIISALHKVCPAYPEEGLNGRPASPAAALVLLAEAEGGLQVLLTKRAQHLRLHPGQVSLPGGKPEHTDSDPGATARRETEEETGLRQQDMLHIGYLAPVLTSSNFQLITAVALMKKPVAVAHRELVPASDEVDEVWFQPLSHLVNLDNYIAQSVQRDGRKREFWKIADTEPVVWGATAEVLRKLAFGLKSGQAIL